jgi:large subunit ribosomal protein L23
MPAEKRAEREQWLDTNFQIQENQQSRKLEMLRIVKGTVLKPHNATKRSQILKLIAERRQKREELVSHIASEWKDMREQGEEIVWGENPINRSHATTPTVTETSS